MFKLMLALVSGNPYSNKEEFQTILLHYIKNFAFGVERNTEWCYGWDEKSVKQVLMKSAFSTFCKLLLLHTATSRYKENNMSYNSPIIQKMADSALIFISTRP